MTRIDSRHIDAQLRSLLCDVLGLEEPQVADFTMQTELFGALPELDSMAVAGLLTEMEDRFHITIDDDEVDGELFETYGNLLANCAVLKLVKVFPDPVVCQIYPPASNVPSFL